MRPINPPVAGSPTALRTTGPQRVTPAGGVRSLTLHGVKLDTRDGYEALTALAQVSERLHAVGDPRAVFPEVYGVITRRVLQETRKARPGFLEPRWIERLMGRFCARYLETLDWSLRGVAQDCEAWRLAYAYAGAEATIPTQDALFGISAHINYDLAIGIADTITEHGHAHDPVMLARYKHDHDYVNELLRESIAECMARLRERHGCRAAGATWRLAGPLVEHGFMAALAAWRQQVWGNVLRLLAAPGEGARRAVLADLDRRSGLIGRAIAGLSAGWLVGRALLPARIVRAMRGLLVAERAAGDFGRLGELGALDDHGGRGGGAPPRARAFAC